MAETEVTDQPNGHPSLHLLTPQKHPSLPITEAEAETNLGRAMLNLRLKDMIDRCDGTLPTPMIALREGYD